MKKILLIIITLILSGCTVNYELEIKKDMSLTERITVLNDESYFNKEGSADKYYQGIVDIGMIEAGYDSYDYLKKDNLYGGIARESYTTIEQYKQNSSAYKNMYDDIEIKNENDIVTLNSVGDLKIENLLFIPEEGQTTDYVIPENTYFSIKVPFEVLEHNADRVDNDYNIFYWDITPNTQKDKSVMIKFDTSKKHTSLIKILKETDYTIPIIVGIIIISIVFINSVLRKNEENNRI